MRSCPVLRSTPQVLSGVPRPEVRMSRFIVFRGNEPERLRLAIHSQRSLLFGDIPDEELLSDGLDRAASNQHADRLVLLSVVRATAGASRRLQQPALPPCAPCACEVAWPTAPTSLPMTTPRWPRRIAMVACS